jgi:prolyl-tRNA editing enzyme YbaK/EbsC (Cys-tRNA(Pro) deacylase)
MATLLPPGAQKVQDALTARGFSCRIIQMPATTRTAKEAAEAIGCTVAQIAKSLVFKTRQTQRPVLVIASGSGRVNEAALGTLLGEPVDKADATFVRETTGFAIGGVPPVGHAAAIVTFLDEALRQHQEIWAAGGSPTAVFQLAPADLERMTGGQWASVCG